MDAMYDNRRDDNILEEIDEVKHEIYRRHL